MRQPARVIFRGVKATHRSKRGDPDKPENIRHTAPLPLDSLLVAVKTNGEPPRQRLQVGHMSRDQTTRQNPPVGDQPSKKPPVRPPNQERGKEPPRKEPPTKESPVK